MRNLLAMAFAGCLVSGSAWAVDDSLYYTLYTPGAGSKSLTWSACTFNTCFASGELGPFKHACAVMDGRPKVHGNTEVRAIYVIDKARPSNTLHLIVYKRTDTFSDSGDVVEVEQTDDLDMSVPWQGSARCAMAGNEQILFAGILGGSYVMVDKHTLAIAASEGTLSFATADANGYVTVGTAESAFFTYDNNGFLAQSGSDTRFTTDTRNAAVLP
jgi:hypothetical protein